MSGLDSHSYDGHLTEENINGVADRLRATLGDRPFVFVRSSPTTDHGRPRVQVGCALTSPIEVVPFADARRGLVLSCGGSSFAFPPETPIAFEGPVFTISDPLLSRYLHHYVFIPEGGRA
ncbi:hypothetical protein ABZ897_60265 [Nonomuraea sp. NPDC046802]|uniref:hypothetical protein n=1 Tax=Nonomuraea sp. NPDC046802 TaxID=3154919 RepID=UPI00340B1B69